MQKNSTYLIDDVLFNIEMNQMEIILCWLGITTTL